MHETGILERETTTEDRKGLGKTCHAPPANAMRLYI